MVIHVRKDINNNFIVYTAKSSCCSFGNFTESMEYVTMISRDAVSRNDDIVIKLNMKGKKCSVKE